VYRRHVLSGLIEIYTEVAKRHAVPTPLARVQQVKTIREWDTLTVVPRFGFASVDDYYARMSAGPRLHGLSCPTLLLPSRHDPMVPPGTFEDLLAGASSQLEVRWVERGGHVGYPGRVALAGEDADSLEQHVARWFSRF
jgi:predicted alpha/beta-fold hydrolase